MAKELEKELENEEQENENLPDEKKKVKKAKKPGRVRKFFSNVYHGVRDNPVTHAVCVGIGVVATLATEAAVTFVRSKKANEYSEPIEVDDLGEEVMDEETEEVEANED